MSTQLDIAQYLRLKKAKRITLGKVGNVFVAIAKRTDPAMGRAVDPEVTPLRVRILKETVVKLKEQIDGINELISDLEALDVE